MSVPIRETSLGAAVVPPRAVETDRARLTTEVTSSELSRADAGAVRAPAAVTSRRALRVIHGLSIAAAVATYLLIRIGGLVHGTGSSLACPDWPTCYGTMMPKMEGGVLVEHSHRLAAVTVAVLTLLLAIMLTVTRAPALRRLRPFGWLAVGLVLAQ